MFFRQIKHVGDNFSYIIADEDAREAVIVDPSFNSSYLIQIINSFSWSVKYILNTHHHRDHVAGNDLLKRTFDSQVVAHQLTKIDHDLGVTEGELLEVGRLSISVIHTPGHSPDSMCLLIGNKLLTGDTLFVGECGRTDLSEGSPEDMYNSLFNKLMALEDDIEVYPGHDYGSKPFSTIGEERRTNYTLEPRSLKEFIEFMRIP